MIYNCGGRDSDCLNMLKSQRIALPEACFPTIIGDSHAPGHVPAMCPANTSSSPATSGEPGRSIGRAFRDVGKVEWRRFSNQKDCIEGNPAGFPAES